MPDGKPTKAPLIIFGTMVTMSIVSVGIVFYTHSQRTEPYLDTKMRRVIRVKRPAPAPTAAAAPTPAAPTAAAPTPAAPTRAGSQDASRAMDAGVDALATP